jgi:polysaccharide biosynthesis/export protein
MDLTKNLSVDRYVSRPIASSANACNSLQVEPSHHCLRYLHLAAQVFGLAIISLLLLSGCKTASPTPLSEQDSSPYRSIVLREGDVVKIAFPAAPNLNTVQQIRRDGKIYLSMVGDITAMGLSPADLEKEILKVYESQLVSKQVTVTLESTQFPVFISGAVLRPGKILVDRPLTVLEAIMEAGGFDYTRANTKSVRIIRHEEGQVKNYTLDLKPALRGEKSTPFYLRPSDIVFVPEKFSMF